MKQIIIEAFLCVAMVFVGIGFAHAANIAKLEKKIDDLKDTVEECCYGVKRKPSYEEYLNSKYNNTIKELKRVDGLVYKYEKLPYSKSLRTYLQEVHDIGNKGNLISYWNSQYYKLHKHRKALEKYNYYKNNYK